MTNVMFKILSIEQLTEIAVLGQKLNPNKTIEEVKQLQKDMFALPAYKCFGLFLYDKLIGISSAWITIRLYSGKQLEVDNVVIDEKFQSKGYGKRFFEFLELWAKNNNCKSIELNTYVQNSRSHKFYYNLGFSILGFHFRKQIA